ncbi:MAG: hypothetical protein WA655_13235 [Candidatus Korobacteraceae bacterium]
MNVPYKKYPNSKGGFLYIAALPVSIAGLHKGAPRSRRFEAIIDSGASNCLFQAALGRAIGLDVAGGEPLETLGISGPNQVFMHDISLYVPGGILSIRAGFSEALPVTGLLGMTGFFDHFKITFDPVSAACVLDRLFTA